MYDSDEKIVKPDAESVGFDNLNIEPSHVIFEAERSADSVVCMHLPSFTFDDEQLFYNRFEATERKGIASLREWEDGTYTLFVNYYTPCTIEFEREEIYVEIKDEAPDDNGKFFLHLIAEGEKLRNVKVRPPYWAQMGDNDSGRKLLGDGRMHHEVWAEYTYSFRIEHPVDRPELGVIFYGPYVLAILDDSPGCLTMDVTEEDLNQKSEVLSMEEFKYEDKTMCPLYLVGDRTYHTYFVIKGAAVPALEDRI